MDFAPSDQFRLNSSDSIHYYASNIEQKNASWHGLYPIQENSVRWLLRSYINTTKWHNLRINLNIRTSITSCDKDCTHKGLFHGMLNVTHHAHNSAATEIYLFFSVQTNEPHAFLSTMGFIAMLPIWQIGLSFRRRTIHHRFALKHHCISHRQDSFRHAQCIIHTPGSSITQTIWVDTLWLQANDESDCNSRKHWSTFRFSVSRIHGCHPQTNAKALGRQSAWNTRH